MQNSQYVSDKPFARRRQARVEDILELANSNGSHEDVFTESEKLLAQIWSRVCDEVAQSGPDDKRTYLFRIKDSWTYYHSVNQLGIPNELAKIDASLTRVTIKRFAFVRQPAGVPLKTAKRKRVSVGYFDAIFTAERLEIFFARKAKNSFNRNNRPDVSVPARDIGHSNSLQLGKLCDRLVKLVSGQKPRTVCTITTLSCSG